MTASLLGVLQDGTKPSEKKKEKLACHSLCDSLAIYSWVKVAGQKEKNDEGQALRVQCEKYGMSLGRFYPKPIEVKHAMTNWVQHAKTNWCSMR